MTPAQDYTWQLVVLLDWLWEHPEDQEATNMLHNIIMKRPKTLRNALASYLYKSQSKQTSRK